MRHTTRLTPPSFIDIRDSFLYYKKYCHGPKNKRIGRQRNWKRVVVALWEEVAASLLQAEAGVYIAGLGYLATWMTPVKRTEKMFIKGSRVKTIYNDHTDHHTYHLHLFTDVEPVNHLKMWTMENMFLHTFRSKFAKQLKAGKRYKLQYSLIKKINKQSFKHND